MNMGNLITGIIREIFYLNLYTLQSIIGAFYHIKPLTTGIKQTVILVPGWMGRSLSLRKLQIKLNAAGYPTHILPLGFQLGDVRKKAQQLSTYLEQHDLNKVIIVSHSLGGLIGLQALFNGDKRIDKLLAVACPFRGNHWGNIGLLAALAVTILLAVCIQYYYALIVLPVFFVKSFWQMRPGSSLLKTLSANYSKMENIQCVHAKFDEMVIPSRSTVLGRANDICVPEIGHNNLIMGDRPIDIIQKTLDQADQK